MAVPFELDKVRRRMAIHRAFDRYRRISEAHVGGREIELAAFRKVNRELEAAVEDRARVTALGKNHTLWSALVRDLSLAENGLPTPIKDQLIYLGFWSMRYSIQAQLNPLPVGPLIAVNQNVLDGLAAQMAVHPAPTA